MGRAAMKRLGTWLEFIVLVFFIWAGVLATLHAFDLQEKGGDAFRIGDWIINYEGGLVRRGLLGQPLFVLGSSGVPVLPVLLSLQVALYWALLTVCYLLARPHLRKGVEWVPLLLSPAGVLFEALNPLSFRKELLAFLVLGIVLLVARQRPAKALQWWVLGAWLFPLLLLAHEGLLLIVPYFILAGLRLKNAPSRRLLSVACGAAGLAFLIALVMDGDPQTAEAIRSSWDGLIPRKSLAMSRGGGAIHGLELGLEDGVFAVQERINSGNPPYLKKFGLLLPLVLVVLMPFTARLRALFADLWGGACLAGIVFMTLGLSALAVDWGRFIHMNFLCISLLLLATPANEPPRSLFRFALAILLAAAVLFVRVPISSGKTMIGLIALSKGYL